MIASRTHWDAIVVGAGITGIAVASELSQAGLSCVVVEKSHPLAGETGHAQGMLHSGLSYPKESVRSFGDELWEAFEIWQPLLPPAPVRPIYYCLKFPDTSLEAFFRTAPYGQTLLPRPQWSDLPFSTVDFGEGRIYESRERIVAPRDAAQLLLDRVTSLELQNGRVLDVRVDDDRSIVSLEQNGVTRQITASVVVFTCGRHNDVTGVAPFKAKVDVRRAMIVVARSRAGMELPQLDVVWPYGEDFYSDSEGLKAVTCSVATHVEAMSNRWLMMSSSLILPAGQPTFSVFSRAELRSRLDVIGRMAESLVPDLERSQLEWGYYEEELSVPRVAGRPQLGVAPLSERNIATSHSDRIITAYSDRMTLAPSVALHVTKQIQGLGLPTNPSLNEPFDEESRLSKITALHKSETVEFGEWGELSSRILAGS